MFNFIFEKTAEEIVAAAKRKVSEVRSKIQERVIRIQDMRNQHNITDTVLIDIQNQMRAQDKRGEQKMSYTSNAQRSAGQQEEVTVVGAGVIDFLQTEQDLIEGERAQVERLELIISNLKEVTAYTANGTPYIVKPKLSYDELKYLGF